MFSGGIHTKHTADRLPDWTQLSELLENPCVSVDEMEMQEMDIINGKY